MISGVLGELPCDCFCVPRTPEQNLKNRTKDLSRVWIQAPNVHQATDDLASSNRKMLETTG